MAIVDPEQFAGCERRNGRGARPGVDQRDLTHETTGADRIDRRSGTSDLDGACDHDIEPALVPALVREHGSGRNLDLLSQSRDPRELVGCEPREQRDARQQIDLVDHVDVVYHGGPPSITPGRASEAGASVDG